MSEQAELTRLGREIIPAALVGKNVEYRVLKEPAEPAYPRGDEFRYSDDYTSRLNRAYSLNDILGERIEGIKEGKMNQLTPLVMGSPLNNAEGEDVLAYMLMCSAQAGEWQPWVIDVPQLTDARGIDTAEKYLKAVEAISPTHNKRMIHGGALFGLSVAKSGGFALPTVYDNKVIAVPSQAFVGYVAQQK